MNMCIYIYIERERDVTYIYIYIYIYDLLLGVRPTQEASANRHDRSQSGRSRHVGAFSDLGQVAGHNATNNIAHNSNHTIDMIFIMMLLI